MQLLGKNQYVFRKLFYVPFPPPPGGGVTHTIAGVNEVGVLLAEKLDDLRLLVEHGRVQQRATRLVKTCNNQSNNQSNNQ